MAPELYEIVIDPLSDADGGGFVATVTELPGCMSDGATQEEALANVKDAIAAWLATATKMGRAIPAPNRVYA
jgi:predicted RNase H-like HicB family nuclease